MQREIKKLIRKFKTNDPHVIAAALNIEVRTADLGRCTKGFYVRKFRRRCIFIHEDLDEPWRRFVCAHELAHDRLHPGLSRFWIDDRSFFAVGKFERQANRFAATLLLAGAEMYSGESVMAFCRRNGVPEEMHEYYEPLQISMF